MNNQVNEARLLCTTDAQVWAEEFAKVQPTVDEGLMIGWFANAIETGRRAGKVIEELEQAVFEALGAASVCWDGNRLGVFQSDKAREIGLELVAWIENRYERKQAPAPSSAGFGAKPRPAC